MSDPIEKLTRLGDALEGAPMPVPASEIRSRGDRIRRRKHAAIAGASAAVVAAVAIPVVALTVGGGDDKAAVTNQPSPSVSDPVPSAALSAENLMTAGDAVWYDVGTDWTEGSTVTGDGQAPPNPCMQESFAGLGAGSVFQRDFTFTAQTDPSDPWPYLTEIVGEFDSAAAAQDAYVAIQGWYDDCQPSGSDRFDHGDFTPVDLPVDGQGSFVSASYGPVAKRLDPFGDEGWFLDTGLVVTGDRIALVTALSHGQDYNFEQTPAQRMVPLAAQRLVLGGGTGEEQTTPPDGESVSLPVDFPLTSGWPTDDGSSEYTLDEPSIDNQAMLAAGDLSGCQAIGGGDPLDRLTARLTVGDATYVREVQLFANNDEALAFLDSVQDAYATCELEGPTDGTPSFTTTTSQGSLGDDSEVITRASDGIGRVVINVVRVGTAIAIDLASDEGTGDTVGDLATVTRENLADVVAALNELGGATTTDPGSGEPTVATSIPADFPLDLALGEPPVADGETTVEGPSADAQGVTPQTMCGGVLAFPNFGSTDVDEPDLAYTVSSVEGYEGRTLRVYPSADAAVAQLELLRSQIQGCARDRAEGGQSDRLWRSFNSNTGYDSVTFGYTYEIVDGVGAPAGELYTVMRVGTGILALQWGGEYSADYQTQAAPNQVDLAQLISGEMCIFTEAGC
ncbi:hypothetical protein F0U44_02460 [Nocardioides humilatus]|uniref:Uncharacterized protein n=1 Tax=Nocardioides humilatus TaxID=2607660 RepID=A0A5B1LKV4_9ACTN|nr:hypothetical protein [Nocardioides humilatus]KAA1421193.1 hypothetical protein F0U44_02460 [Nocardioides humilatus]